MATWHNETGRPLAAARWLDAHHRAKLPERTAFGHRLARIHPKSVLDLGCATGLWLSILHELLPPECKFIGVDSDEAALEIARRRAKSWGRRSEFLALDIDDHPSQLPAADLTLAFNLSSYVSNFTEFVAVLANRVPRGVLAIRQYDGAAIRFGPMDTTKRQAMEVSLRASLQAGRQFEHYDMDRTYDALQASSYARKHFEFELFSRATPFPPEFCHYYRETLEWTRDLLSDADAAALRSWIDQDAKGSPRYFFEVDLVALLS